MRGSERGGGVEAAIARPVRRVLSLSRWAAGKVLGYECIIFAG